MAPKMPPGKIKQGKSKIYRFKVPVGEFSGEFSIEVMPETIGKKTTNALYVKNEAGTERGDSLYDFFLEGVVHLTAELVDSMPEINKRKLNAAIVRALKGYDPAEYKP